MDYVVAFLKGKCLIICIVKDTEQARDESKEELSQLSTY